MYYSVTPKDDGGNRQKKRAQKRPRADAPKEKVLHTRVPAVLEDELKRLAKNLRVPVSNVVRAILEDAVDAVDTVGEVAQGELLGFVDRLAKQRASLRGRIERRDREDPEETVETEEPEPEEDRCPEEADEVLEGAFGFQPLRLAADTECTVCGTPLPAGSEACRALFDEPGKRVFLATHCRLMPEKE